MKRQLCLSLLALALVAMPGCGATAQNPPPTKVANVADVATKVQQSANVILHAVQNATNITIPSTGKPLVTHAQLDQVALAVNKLGHLGVTLDAALRDYSKLKAAGADVSVQTMQIQQLVNDVTGAVNQITTAIPKGTLDQVDQGVAAILDFMVVIKGGL